MTARVFAPLALPVGLLLMALGLIGASYPYQRLADPLSYGTIPAGVGTTVISAKPGRFYGINVTATGGTAAVTCFDNATAASGTIIGVTPAAPAAGSTYSAFSQGTPVVNGITCAGASGSVTATVPYS